MANFKTEDLDALMDRPGSRTKITFNSNVNKKTRTGVYLTIRSGLITRIFFVGRDLESDQDIIELVGP